VAGMAKFLGKHRRYDNATYEQQLRARSTQLDLAGHVHFPGEVEDVASVYGAADLLLVSTHGEPFGRVVIEAMAAGCPVVATRAGGVPEIITYGVDGWLVPPENPAAMAQAAITLLDDPERRAVFARQGKITVETRFALPGYI